MNNVKKFEDVDLEDLKGRYPTLDIIHLLVDTTSSSEDEWLVINRTDQ